MLKKILYLMFICYKIMEVMVYRYQMWYHVYDHEKKSSWTWLCILFNSAAKMRYYINQYHVVQHVGELLQVKFSCKLYYTEFDSPLTQDSGWRLSCQSVCLQHRQLWQHSLQGSRNTHKADFCLWTLSGDGCQSWKSAWKPVRGFCILLCQAIFSA